MTDYPAPIGEPPAIVWLPTCALMVDHSYQRLTEVPASCRIIDSIARRWDWRLCSPLTVSHRSPETTDTPGYFIIDGQHRFLAAEQRGDIEELPCIVSSFESVEDEARCFVSINAVRKMPTRLDRLHAECASSQSAALELREIVEDAGLKLARTPSFHTWRAGEVAFVGSIARAIREYGRPFASAALVNIQEAFGHEVLRSGKMLFEGLVLVHAKTVGDLDPDELLVVLAQANQALWVSRAKYYRANGATSEAEAMRRAILNSYAAHIGADLIDHQAA